METIEEKTYRIFVAAYEDIDVETPTFEESLTMPDFRAVCKAAAILIAEERASCIQDAFNWCEISDGLTLAQYIDIQRTSPKDEVTNGKT